MMVCFRKVLVFVCLINLLMILCISFVTGDEVDDDDLPLPDLQVSADIRLDPAIPVKGLETEIMVGIFNNATVPAETFSVYLFIDDAFVDYRFLYIMQNQYIDLAPFVYVFGDNKEYNIKIIVDPTYGDNGNVTEMNELNNEASRTTEVIAPNLTFSTEIMVWTDDGLTILEPNRDDLYEIVCDHVYKIIFNVLNKGEADAKKVWVNFRVFYQDDADEWIEEFEDNSTLNNIKAGKSATMDFSWLPLQYATTYGIILIVDPNEYISEESEKNNKLEKKLFITGPKPKEHDRDYVPSYSRNNILNSICPPWMPFLLVICSLLIFAVYRWSKIKTQE